MPVRKRGLHILQKISMSFMAVLVIMTFVGANMHALLWQSSDWLVSTVLPAVVVELTNEEREDNQSAPLRRNATLDQAAQLKAEHMAQNEYFSHFSPDGVSPWHWFREAGYVYAHAGENLAVHFTDSAEVVEAWMNSPTHRQNIVDSRYTEIGVGTAKGSFDGYDTVYVVQLFGTPAIAPAPEPASTPTPTPVPEPDPVPSAVETAPLATADEVQPIASVADEEVEIAPVFASEFAPVSESVPGPASESNSRQEVAPLEDVTTVEPAPGNFAEVPTEESVIPETTADLFADNEIALSQNDSTLVAETSLISISSGLEPAPLAGYNERHAGGTLASIATQPNTILQFAYTTLAIVVILMLAASIVLEVRNFNYQQVAYGFLLLAGMGGLWYAHALLTTGAVIA
jgi:hypothetical protein